MIDFPNTPVIGDIFKTGKLAYKFDGTSWLSTPPGSTLADAPSNGKLYGRKDAAWTQVPGTDLLPDGSVNFPAIAWANDLSLGWFRYAAGTIATANAGKITGYLSASDPALTAFSLSPRNANASTVLYLSNQPSGAADANVLQIKQEADGNANLISGVGGAATRKALGLTFSDVALNGQTVNMSFMKTGNGTANNIWGKKDGQPRWVIVPGTADAESTGNAGSDFMIGGYSDAGAGFGPAMRIKRATAAVSFPGMPVFQGDLQNELTGTKTILTAIAINITNNGSALTIWEGGTYMVMAQQLISGVAGGPALYFSVFKNGAPVKSGYATGELLSTYGPIDMTIVTLFSMAPGDYISFNITGGSAAAVWNGQHTSLTVHKVN